MECECGAQLTYRNKPGSDGATRCARCAKLRRQRKYDHSEKGVVARKRHSKSEAFKMSQKRYLQSEKGKAKQRRYAQSKKGKAVFAKKQYKRYWADPDYYRKKALERAHSIQNYELDDYCGLCGTKYNLSLDHKHPQYEGGIGSPENLWTLCISCNSFKQHRLFTAGNYPGVIVR